MQFEGALIKEQGVTFAVVIVKRSVLQGRVEADRLSRQFSAQAFGGSPVVLMAQDSSGVPTYYGRSDLSKFMANVPLQAVPWKKFTVS